MNKVWSVEIIDFDSGELEDYILFSTKEKAKKYIDEKAEESRQVVNKSSKSTYVIGSHQYDIVQYEVR